MLWSKCGSSIKIPLVSFLSNVLMFKYLEVFSWLSSYAGQWGTKPLFCDMNENVVIIFSSQISLCDLGIFLYNSACQNNTNSDTTNHSKPLISALEVWWTKRSHIGMFYQRIQGNMPYQLLHRCMWWNKIGWISEKLKEWGLCTPMSGVVIVLALAIW